MGKKRNNNTSKRDTFDIANESELLREFIQKKSAVRSPPTLHLSPPKFNLKQIDDRRTFHPKPLTRPAGALKRSATRLVVPKQKASVRASLPHQVQFQAPKHVLICIRRKRRRQVLFALKRTRRGAGSRKRRSAWSDIKC